MSRDLAYYRRQPYQRLWETREDAGERYFVVRIAEFPRIAGDGATRSEALTHLREAFDDFIAWRIEDGLDIPDPFRGIIAEGGRVLELEWVDEAAAVDPTETPKAVACWDLKGSDAEQACPASVAESPPRTTDLIDVGALSSAA